LRLFIRSEKGAVSIYLIIIITVIFFFNAVLIDYTRIMVADRKTERALKAGVRSVLSAYDSDLQKYGLYALGVSEDDAKEVFNHVFNQNLSTEFSSDLFKFVDTRLEKNSVDIQFKNELSQHGIFEQQILEEMKYRAPIEFLLEVVDKLAPVKRGLEKSSKTVKENIKEVKKYEQFKEIMDKIKSDLTETIRLKDDIREIEKVKSVYKPIEEDEVENDKKENDKIKNGLVNTEDIRSTINRATYLKTVDEAINDALNIMRIEGRVKTNLAEAKALSKKLKEYKSTGSLGSEENKNNSNLDEGHIACDIPDKKEHDLNFTQLGSMSFPSFLSTFKSLKSLKGELQSNNASSTVIAHKIDVSLDKHDAYYNEVFDIDQRFNKLINKIENIDHLTKKIAQCFEREKEKTHKDLNTVMQEIEKFKSNKEQYKILKEFYTKYLNDQPGEGLSKEIRGGTDEIAEEALNLMDIVFQKASNTLIELSDEAYINEYVLSKFNYLTFNAANSFDPAQSEEHKLIQQEVEYILYGMHHPKLNNDSALVEIFTLRLAIRMIEGFERYKYLGVPKLIAIAAVTYGIIKARQDLNQLKAGEAVKLTKYTPKIRLDYQDHIRLFLLIHSNEIKKLSRIQSLIEFNTNIDLETKYTYIEATASTTIRLWFIPGVMKALNIVGALDGQVEGNRYQIIKKAAMSY
jgi:hypothetical protein